MDTGKDWSEMKPEDRKRLKQHIEMIMDHKMPAQLSSVGRIMQALRSAKEAQVGVTFDYFNVIELLGHIKALEEYAHTDIVDEMSVVVKTSLDNNKGE